MSTAIKSTRHTPEQRRAQAQALHEKLTDQIRSLTDSDTWKAWLRITGTCRARSLSNQLLILSQGGTYALGYRQWEKLGRHVIRGAKAIKIFGYSVRHTPSAGDDDEQDTEPARVSYPVLNVFDISATDGNPIPAAATPLTGADPARIYDRAAAYATTLGWDVAATPIPEPGLNGYTLPALHQIRVDATMDPAMRAKTLLHELGHAILHATTDTDPSAHRGTIETEAESVAYAAGNILGLDTTDYSIGYITGWANADIDLIRATADNVLRAVTQITDALTA